MYKGSSNGGDAKAKGDGRNEPARTKPLAGHVGWDFEDDVADVEDGQHAVVVVARHAQVFLKASNLRIADIGAVDEAEQIEQCDGRDDVEIDLQSQPCLGFWVELDKGVAEAAPGYKGRSGRGQGNTDMSVAAWPRAATWWALSPLLKSSRWWSGRFSSGSVVAMLDSTAKVLCRYSYGHVASYFIGARQIPDPRIAPRHLHKRASCELQARHRALMLVT